MSADFVSQFEAIDVAELKILNQRGEELIVDGAPVVFHIYGPGSAIAVKAQAKVDAGSHARLMTSMRGGKAPNPEDARREQVEKLVACTASISPNFPVEPAAIYNNPKLGYITDQVTKFQSDWANFPCGSLKS